LSQRFSEMHLRKRKSVCVSNTRLFIFSPESAKTDIRPTSLPPPSRLRPLLWLLVGLIFILKSPSFPCLALTSEEQNTIEVYRKAHPGVVHIRTVVVRYGFFFQPTPVEGTGSGIILDRRGHIATNAHVIRDARSIEVTLSDGSHWPARLVRSLPQLDLAVVRIDAPKERLHPIPLGESRELRVGQKVLAIGNPFGLQHTLTTGIISSLGREMITQEGVRLRGLIQTDAAINPGNSGGPLLDREGRLIGINTAILSPSGGNVGIGFAIPVETLRLHLPKLTRSGPSPATLLLAAAGLYLLARIFSARIRKGPRW